MSDYPMLISNKLHSFRNFLTQKYDSFLDLLSMRMKTNRNKIVSFAADFKKEYEKIYNRYIDDVSIHQYFVSSNG